MIPFIDDDFRRIVVGWFSRAGEILFGRSTNDMMDAFWRQVTDSDDPAATALNTLPKRASSRTPWKVHGSWQLVGRCTTPG